MQHIILLPNGVPPTGLSVPPDIAASDDAIRAHFREVYRGINHAQLKRETKGEIVYISIIPPPALKDNDNAARPANALDPNTLTTTDISARLQVALDKKGWTRGQFGERDYDYRLALEYTDLIGELLHALGGSQWTIEIRSDDESTYFDATGAQLIASRSLPSDDEDFIRTETHQMCLPLDAREGDEAEEQINLFATDLLVMLKRCYQAPATAAGPA